MQAKETVQTRWNRLRRQRGTGEKVSVDATALMRFADTAIHFLLAAVLAGVWGLRSLWSGAGWGGGLRRVRCGGAGGGLLRLYGAAGLCGRAAVCRRSHLDLCGGLRLL